MDPMVSVMMPCYNGADTLPLALSSLLAQTHERWECVLVDDGSTDNPAAVVEWLNDPRVRLVSLPRNMGRGVARQVALDHARGDYLAMLDADDWIYPDKLAHQVAFMEAHPTVRLHSLGLASVGFLGTMAGVRLLAPRGTGATVKGPLTRPGLLPVAFGSSMVRLEDARRCRFDPRLRLSQDTDFMIQLLLGHRFAVSDKIGYVYTELVSRTPQKQARAQRYTEMIYRKYLDRYPLTCARGIIGCRVKRAVLSVAGPIGLAGPLMHRGITEATFAERDAFQSARRVVEGARPSPGPN